MKHTPAPWKLFSAPQVTEILGSDDIPIVSWPGFDDSRRDMKTHKANACLITAAPELLAALEALFENCTMIHAHWGDGDNTKQADEAIANARAAIARAKGE